jgi:hypothetical protein
MWREKPEADCSVALLPPELSLLGPQEIPQSQTLQSRSPSSSKNKRSLDI